VPQPPTNYGNYLPIIEHTLGSGIEHLIHTTGFDAIRVITTSLPRKNIDPCWTPGNQQRANLSGNFRLFTADKKKNAYLETFGHSGDGKIP
jgi:hypothetical protein